MSKNKYQGHIGIDLGTTNCVVSIINEKDEVELIPNKDGNYITPSFIFVKEDFSETDGFSVIFNVGDKAKAKMLTEPKNVLYSYKPFVGTDRIIKTLSGKPFTAQHCSFLMLKYLKESAEDYLNEVITSAVITVPAYYNENQKASVMATASSAGLKVLGLIQEPSSAAIHYLREQNKDEELTTLVYDLGGGTFDTTLLFGKYDGASVIGLTGDHYLGGDDIDKGIMTYLKNKKSYKNIDDESFIKICEELKIKLSKMKDSDTDLDDDELKADTKISNKKVELTYSELRDIAKPTIDRTLKMVLDLINDNGYTVEDIDKVLLVGGSTKLPLIREELIKIFGDDKVPSKVVDPDLAVGYGAGEFLRVLMDKDITNSFTNVTPMPIGVKMKGGKMQVIIDGGQEIPCTNMIELANSSDECRDIDLSIYEGYNINAEDNTEIGKITIPMDRAYDIGTYKINLSAKIDKNGLLSLRAIADKVYRLKIKRDVEKDFDDINKDSILSDAKFTNKTDSEENLKWS